ncbi:hypothetical protein BDV40DRAFT_298228 [Aspergillus tamarii]|uniref:Uncharacterized protein n=1 Tax=Aspergillus tamarii TaxID=41984 RepID=A0A5N6V1P9_ASPTM|nr:hypothetical protein BDV40DRAFT_298228 [Aspergillus tamarii]
MASATSANHATSVAKMLVSNVVAAVVPFGISVGVATTLVSHVAVRRSSERRCVAALERSDPVSKHRRGSHRNHGSCRNHLNGSDESVV